MIKPRPVDASGSCSERCAADGPASNVSSGSMFSRSSEGRGGDVVEGRLRVVVDGVLELLRLGGRALFVAEVPQQLQCQGRLGEYADRLRATDIG
jgi:hypothetical protein